METIKDNSEMYKEPIFNMEPVRCPLCNSNRYKSLYNSKDRLRLTDYVFCFVKCISCGLVYQNPRVQPDDIGHFYPGWYYAKREHSARKLKVKCELIARAKTGVGSLLEVGSANGDFLNHIGGLGWYVEGVETSEDGIKYSRDKYNIQNLHCGELVERVDNGVRFDIIVLWGVLPHIPNPVATIMHASELLKDSGVLIICCANIDSIPANIMKDNWGHLDLPRHYCMYSPTSLQKLLETANLQADTIIFHENLWNSNINIFALRPFSIVNDMLYAGGNNLMKKVIKRVAHKTSRVLSNPLLLMSRLFGRGGIMTVFSTKKSNPT